MPGDLAGDSDPRHKIEQILHRIADEALREFLADVVAEPGVRLALMPVTEERPLRPRTSVLARLLQASYTASVWSAHDAQRETLFVATFIRGVQELLGAQVADNTCTPSELTLAIVRSALHRLDDKAPAQSRLLRLALGWGNEDEVDAVLVPHIRHTVLQALRSAGLIRPCH